MKQSIGYTVTLNIIIVFLVIIFTFLSAALIYFKSNKVSNVITETIEKHEGYNTYAISEIGPKLDSWGYSRNRVNCADYYNKIGNRERSNCSSSLANGSEGYCVFVCREMFDGEWYYYYKISTNLMLNVPLLNGILNIPIFSNTNRLYDFECQSSSC